MTPAIWRVSSLSWTASHVADSLVVVVPHVLDVAEALPKEEIQRLTDSIGRW